MEPMASLPCHCILAVAIGVLAALAFVGGNRFLMASGGAARCERLLNFRGQCILAPRCGVLAECLIPKSAALPCDHRL